MSEKNVFTIKNKNTGFTYDLTKEECDKLVIEEPDNFEVIDKDYISPIKEPDSETSTYNQVVIKESEKGQNKTGSKSIEDYNTTELKEYCKKHGLSTKGSKAELQERALDFRKCSQLREKYKELTGEDAADDANAYEVESLILAVLIEKAKEKGINPEDYMPPTIEKYEQLLSEKSEE